MPLEDVNFIILPESFYFGLTLLKQFTMTAVLQQSHISPRLRELPHSVCSLQQMCNEIKWLEGP